MIKKASELLEQFINVEREKLKGVDIEHMPTLGSAYEEITKKGISADFVIPDFLNLKAVSGFIEVSNQILPEQIDCMLVVGEGKRYGLTDNYIYDIDKVLCIFEVKKTLRKRDYLDAFKHLRKVRQKFSENFERKLKEENYAPDVAEAKKHFERLTGKIAPSEYSDIHRLEPKDAILFYTLVQESLAPISVIQGYEGYKTESGLRKAFIDVIEKENENNGGQDLGVPSLPSLVASDQYCLVKSNGIPFVVIEQTGAWPIICSTRNNSALILLDMIWTKISKRFNVVMPWGDGLDIDNLSPVLLAIPTVKEHRAGWTYKSIEIPEAQLEREGSIVWTPVALEPAEVSTVQQVAAMGGYLQLNEQLDHYLKTEFGSSLERVAKTLTSSFLFMCDGDFLRPINMHTSLLVNEDGSGYISSEQERFDLWCDKNAIDPSYINIIFLE
ncbi:MAG: hypothetical protein HWE07_15705 [Cytophagia bacterium]|nr:hypothetical protein [Cytophagia bacterium]